MQCDGDFGWSELLTMVPASWTLSYPCISESCIKIKINLNFYFHNSLWCLKRSYEGFKAIIKPLEVPQRSEKIKFKFIFSFCPRLGREGFKLSSINHFTHGIHHSSLPSSLSPHSTISFWKETLFVLTFHFYSSLGSCNMQVE